MEKKYKIQLNSQQEQVDFVKACSSFAFDINLHKGSYVVDAKSLLGVCTMDTSNGCYVKINDALTDNQIQKFEGKIKEWRA